MKDIVSICAITLLAGCAPAMVSSPTTATSGAFVTTLGVDTVAFERYTRTPASIEGEVINRYQGTRHFRYKGDIGPGGQLRSLTIASRRLGVDTAQPPMSSITMSFDDTLAMVDVARAGRPDTAVVRRRALVGRSSVSFPGFPPSFGLYELMIAARGSSDSVAYALQNTTRGPNPTMWVVRRGPTQFDFINTWQPNWVERVRTDNAGRILEVNATRTTVGTISRRVSDLRAETVIRAWAPESARSRPILLSPPDTARSVVAGSSIEIAYSRPSRRGRVTFGGDLVPWGRVWRTGANAATTMSTSRDLVFGNITVPAGKYTLFLLPTVSGSKLIINSQTGQWGTEHDPAKDFTRIDLVTRRLDTPVEQFTIIAEPRGSGGVLRLRWDTYEFFAPFSVK